MTGRDAMASMPGTAPSVTLDHDSHGVHHVERASPWPGIDVDDADRPIASHTAIMAVGRDLGKTAAARRLAMAPCSPLGRGREWRRPCTDREASAAKTKGVAAVIGVNVTFEYDGDLDRDRVINVAEKARGTFEGMPGLRFKFFTFDEKGRRATNFYVWDSKEAAEGFFSEELRERVTGLYGVSPRIDFVEIAEIVDNTNM
jgi:hypothetical protein